MIRKVSLLIATAFVINTGMAANIDVPSKCKEKYALPEGCWKTIDDNTGEEKSIILIKKNSMGEFTGKVIKVIKTDDGSNPETKRCDKCEGDKKDQLINGMTVMWGVKQDGDEWTGGQILDPKTGSVYSVKFTLSEDNTKLNVRGYIGFSMLGRSQTWLKV